MESKPFPATMDELLERQKCNLQQLATTVLLNSCGSPWSAAQTYDVFLRNSSARVLNILLNREVVPEEAKQNLLDCIRVHESNLGPWPSCLKPLPFSEVSRA